MLGKALVLDSEFSFSEGISLLLEKLSCFSSEWHSGFKTAIDLLKRCEIIGVVI